MAKQAGVEALRVRLLVQQLRRGRRRPARRDGALNPVTAYGDSKVQAESELARTRRRRASARPSCAPPRPTASRPRMRFDIVLNNLVAWAVTTGHIHLKSDGTPWRPIVHIEDISRAFIAALEAPGRRSATRPSTSGGPRRTTAFASSPRSSPSVVPGCEIDLRRRRRPRHAQLPGELREDQPRAPRVPAAMGRPQGGRAALRRLTSSGLRLEEFEGPRYQRIAHIKKLLAEGSIDLGLRGGVTAEATTAVA